MDNLENKAEDKTIAIDAMTAEIGVEVLCEAVREYTKENPNVKIILFGNHELFEQKNIDVLSTECQFVEGVIDKNKPFMEAFKDRNNSTWKTIEYARNGKADVGISFGRTDVVVAYARNLRRIGGVRKSPLATFLPSISSKEGCVLLADIGAFTECKSSDLLQFAIMGSCFYEIKAKRKPRVGLLNIGTEEYKGKGLVPEAHEFLKSYAGRDEDFDYIGYVEAWDIHDSHNKKWADVIVTDGTTGNHIIKDSRGLANYARTKLRESFYRNLRTKLAGALYKWGGGERQLQSTINPDQYGGAYFLGLERLFVKGHGSANKDAMKTAIVRAYECGSGWGVHNAILERKLRIAREIIGEAYQGQGL